MNQHMLEEMRQLNYLISELDAAYHEAALKLGLSDSAMRILYTICNHGDSCLLSEICRLSGMSKQTVNSAIRKLEREQIVFLEMSEGRKKRVFLTDAGKALAEKTVFRLIETENAIYSGWSAEELREYTLLTQRFLVEFQEKIKTW